MHKNSLAAWHGEVKPTLRRRQLQVLKVYQNVGEATARDIMAVTGQSNNVIQPRIGELRDLGYLVEIGDKKIDGRKHAILKPTELGEHTDTSKVSDITPAKRYYSKEDYKKIVREVYDHLALQLSPEDQKELYEELKLFLATK